MDIKIANETTNNAQKRRRTKQVLTPEQKEASYQRTRAWVEANREKHNAAVRAHRKRCYIIEGSWQAQGKAARDLNAWMIELKSVPCTDCRNSFAVCCMDFDHRVGTTKSYNVGSMFAHHYSRALIEIEIAKCDLVCANCHRIRTRDRRTGSGTGGRG